jgi:hypothetical protein
VASIARLIAELAEVRVISDRRADQLVTQAETIGQLRADLAGARAQQSPLEPSTEPAAPEPAVDSPMPRWHVWWPGLAALLVLLAMWAVVLVPR